MSSIIPAAFFISETILSYIILAENPSVMQMKNTSQEVV